MHIGLIFPKSTRLEDPMTMPPLGLWYLAAQLEAQGHTTDFRALDVDPFPADGEFDQIWISATSPQMHAVRQLARDTQNWEKTVTVFGGAASWARPDTAQGLFDVTVSGEADHPDTVRAVLRAGESVRWQGPPDEPICPAITPGELSWVLPPVRRWDDKYHFFLTDHNGRKHRTTTAFTSRGCPMACAFCESGRNGVIWDRTVRYEPVSIVDAQLHEIVERGHTGVMFYDDIMPLNKPRTLEVMRALKKYGLVSRCFLRTDVISKQGGLDYLREMADAGLLEVLAGVESGDNRIKANIHKGTTIEQDTQVMKWCQELGIRFKASIILGLPGEDQESLERTREWILIQRPDRVDVCTLIPFPGTPITRSHDYQGNEYDVYWTEQNLPEEHWYKASHRESDVIVGTSHLTPFQIKEFRDKLIAEIAAAGIPY